MMNPIWVIYSVLGVMMNQFMANCRGYTVRTRPISRTGSMSYPISWPDWKTRWDLNMAKPMDGSRGKDCVFWHFLLPNVLRATTACIFSTSQLRKVVRDRRVLPLLTSKCSSRHKGVHFFDISTSKSAPSMAYFATFDFKMCFAPKRRAIFHLSSGQLPPHPPL